MAIRNGRGGARLAGLALLAFGLLAGGPLARASDSTPQMELKGKVVCLPELMNRLYGVELVEPHQHLYGFQADNGELFTLLRTKYSEALFADDRVRAKQLLLKGRVLPKSHLFEVSRIRSVRNGVVYDLHYYCNVCNIEAVSPGRCECCQGPVELVEKPLPARAKAKGP
jgi:hypothetical protein